MSRPRLVLVHGSVVGGRATWTEQRRGIGDEADLVVLERPGFEPPPDPGPPVPGSSHTPPPTDLATPPVPGFSRAPPPTSTPRVDFEEHAVWVAGRLRPGDHLVGHSYGGVIALLAAARDDRLASLTVIEPPCTSVALDVPAVEVFARQGAELYASGARLEPEAFLRTFLAAVGSDFDPPSPLPPALEQGARALAGERGPWEAEIPLDLLAARRLPTLVVSGAHHPAFEAICDVLERALSAERLVLRGHGHNAQLHPAFNAALLAFVTSVERRR